MELGKFHRATENATEDALAFVQLYRPNIEHGDHSSHSRIDNMGMQLLIDRGWSFLQLRDDLDAAYIRTSTGLP
jgi:hypothetical protein